MPRDVPDHGIEVIGKAGEQLTPGNGSQYRIRTKITNSAGEEIPVIQSPSGLNNGGKVTEVTINDTTWTALPATPLTDRNAVAIQNVSGFEMKVNYVTGVGYVGMVVAPDDERQYDIKDTILIYGRLESGAGSAVVNVEELS